MPASVSVIIPTFDRAHVLSGAIESVLGQSDADFEVIVVDDGSRDDTRQIVDRVAATDPRVRYRHQANAGAAAARNAGIDLATGELIAFLDSDDTWAPWHLSLTKAALDRHPAAGMIWTDLDAVLPDGTVRPSHLTALLSAYRYFPLDLLFPTSWPLAELGVDLPRAAANHRLYVGDVFSAMVMGNLINASSAVLRRERIGEAGRFDETFRTGEDYDFFMRVCRAGPVAFADIADSFVRIGTADRLSGSAQGRLMASSYLRVLTATLAADRDRITLSQALVIEAQAYANRWVGEMELLSGSPRVARANLAISFKLRPRLAVLASLTLAFLPREVVACVIGGRRRIRSWLQRGK